MGANGQNGEHKTDGTLAGEHAYFQSMMDAITQSGVALAAVWDFKGVYSGHDWSVGPGSGREYQLQAIAAANDAYAKTDRALRG
jgi:hypothetical protein